MKKTISILFLILYVAINTGLIIGVHNCLVKGNDYFLGATESTCCCSASGIASDSSCCNETTFIVKFEDVQTMEELQSFKLFQPVVILPYIKAVISEYGTHYTHLSNVILNQQWRSFTDSIALKSPKFILYQQPKLYA